MPNEGVSSSTSIHLLRDFKEGMMVEYGLQAILMDVL